MTSRWRVFLFGLLLALGLQSCGVNGLFSPPTATALPGRSQANPVQVGSEVAADGMRFMLTGAIRPADDLVLAGDMFNQQAGQYKHYVFASLDVTCEKPEPCRLDVFKFKLLGSDDVVHYPEAYLVGVDGLLISTDFQNGSSLVGNLAYIVNIGTSHLVLMYGAVSGEKIYLALP